MLQKFRNSLIFVSNHLATVSQMEQAISRMEDRIGDTIGYKVAAAVDTTGDKVAAALERVIKP